MTHQHPVIFPPSQCGAISVLVFCLSLAGCSTFPVKDNRPELDCQRLVAFDPADWASVACAFQAAPGVPLGQAWLESGDPEFRPAVVKAGWMDDTLWIFAELEDVDAHNPLRGHNGNFFQHGDVFEVFLRPLGQPAYFEFHVTPHNDIFQLRIPSAGDLAALSSPTLPPGKRGSIEDWKVAAPLIRSWSRVDRASRRWMVLLAVPFEAVVEGGGCRRDWLFSFSRYDYTRSAGKPVLSSSSPHARLSFHRQQEWGRLRFVGKPARDIRVDSPVEEKALPGTRK